ncbi:MAG: peptidyl-prolyl cis-trans isomerase [bacterium]|nr:peptidyl-prolyl cis-trans isomerase [bacterium]
MKVSVTRWRTFSYALGLLILLVAGCLDKSVTAKIDYQRITEEELEEALRVVKESIPEALKDRLALKDDRLMNDLIEMKVLSREATKAGLENDREIRKEIERTKSEILARYFVKKYIDQQATPAEEKIERYYQEHKDAFVIPEGILMSHIVVKRAKQAQEVMKLLQEGISFEEVAKRNSICRCWKKGGKHGWLSKGKIEPELEKTIYALEKGKISEIIPTGKNYQIVRILDKRESQHISFEEAKKNIYSLSFAKRKDELVNRYYQEAKVKISQQVGILAWIGNKSITEKEIAPIVDRETSKKEKERLREKWTRYLIEREVFASEARKVGLEHDPQVALELKIKSEQILANAFRRRFIIDKIKISNQEIKDYYQSHLEEFRAPLKIRVSYICANTGEEAENILRELKGGASFHKLATKKSSRASNLKAGETGWFGKGEKDSAFEKAAFALEKGEVSGVVKTEDGYEIISLLDKKGGEIKPLDEVKSTIKIKLMTQRMYQKLEEAKRHYKIEVKSFKREAQDPL